MRFTHIDVNFDVKYEGHQNCSKTLSMHILRVFGHHHMWHQNWHHYVWTSLCEFIFLWTSSIVCASDFLTFDIFLTTWHLFWHMGNGTCQQMGIMVNTEDRDGASWGMGHMGNRAHGQRGIMVNTEYRDGVPWGWGTWVMGHMVDVVMCWIMCNFLNTVWIFIKIWLHIDIDVFYLNILWFFHVGLL